jgi:hypothetical protein
MIVMMTSWPLTGTTACNANAFGGYTQAACGHQAKDAADSLIPHFSIK